MDKSWLNEASYKDEEERAWSSQVSHGFEMKRLANKIEGLWRRLMVLQKYIQEERSKRRNETFTKIKQLHDLEDRQGLEEEEAKKT